MAEFIRVVSVLEVPDPGKTLVEVEGEMVALFHVDGRWYAIDDICTHDGGPLADGELRDFRISCPRHGARFDIRTGAALTMPAVRPTRAHEVKLEDDAVWIRLRETPLAAAAGLPAEKTAEAAGPAQSSDPHDRQPQSAGSAAQNGDPAPANSGGTDPEPQLCEDVVREILKCVKDPELFVNIVDLGLIYGVTLTESPELAPRQHVAIDMTMTSPACPAGPQLIADTKRALVARPDVAQVEVRIVMDPPWTPDRMTDAARDQLGIY